MGTVAFVVTLIVGIAAVLALVGAVVFLVYRRRYRAAHDRLTVEIEAESVVRPWEKGVYRGATAPGYPSVRNNGRIALTRRRLVFLTLTGTTITIPLDQITGLGQSKVFKASVAGGWTHLVVHTAGGDVGFFVPDLDAWLRALGQATGLAPNR